MRTGVLLATVSVVAACAPAHVQEGSEHLAYLGGDTFATGWTFQNTTVGGLSAISYDPDRDLYYVISDDRSQHNPARFYTVRIPITDGRMGEVEFLDARTLLDSDGQPFEPHAPDADPPVLSPDPEGLAFDVHRQQLYWSSEGERSSTDSGVRMLDPWIRIAGLDGSYRGEFTMPPSLRMSADQKGPRQNKALEGLTVTPSGEYVWAGMEEPGYTDGPPPSADAGALTRITKFDVNTLSPVAQYAYPLDPITAPGGDSNGLSDLVAVDEETFLVLERSHGEHNVARIYQAEIAAAQDVLGQATLSSETVTPMTKTLVADLPNLPGVPPLDNLEGITLGPKLADGRRMILLVSDNNFSLLQVTQFLAFGW